MAEATNVLHVANMEQKIIFFCEMQGQLSDGNWENTRPHDHWKIWCNLDWNDIKVDPYDVGRNFYPIKDNYNFANKQLLDIVGERIITKINLVLQLGEPILAMLKENHWGIPDSIEEYKRWLSYTSDDDSYWKDKVAKLQAAGITLELYKEALLNGTYTAKDLKKDCQGLKLACRSGTKW